MKREPKFKSEADLCAAFNEWAKRKGWTPYAETEGWDVLLVAPDGTQIGIQAKLRFNLDVLIQAVEEPGQISWGNNKKSGPDFRAVLVPDAGSQTLCAALGLTMIWCGSRDWHEFYPQLPDVQWGAMSDWHYLSPDRRHKLPAYIPDVVAGASSPVQLTRWKIGALQVTAVLELRGYVTRQDFKRYGIDYRRWINYTDWVIPGTKPGEFVRGPSLTFDKQHPVVYPEIREEIAAVLKAQQEFTLTSEVAV